MVILHIDGALAIFLLFCDHQDTEYEKQEKGNTVAGPIFTQRKILKTLCYNYIHNLQYLRVK